MKHLTIAFALAFLLSSNVSRSDSGNERNCNSNYMIECHFDNVNHVYVIAFEVSEQGMVMVQVVDELNAESITIAEGEMEKGQYKVFFKPPETYSGNNCRCNMKVHSTGSDELVYANSIELK